MIFQIYYFSLKLLLFKKISREFFDAGKTMKTIADKHENNTEFIEEYQRVFNGKLCSSLIFYYAYRI